MLRIREITFVTDATLDSSSARALSNELGRQIAQLWVAGSSRGRDLTIERLAIEAKHAHLAENRFATTVARQTMTRLLAERGEE
jgi:hypothetical protein